MVSLSVVSDPTPDQIDQITALYRAEGWWSKEADDPAHVAGLINGSHVFIAAVTAESVIGMGRAISDRISDAYIQDVTVKKEHRGEGIGTTIVKDLVNRLTADGIDWVGLIAEKDSHGFYTRLGFKKMPNSVPLLHLKP